MTEPGASFTAKGKRDGRLLTVQARRAAGIGVGEFRQAFSKDLLSAGRIGAGKSSDVNLKLYAMLAPGEIGQGSHIPALDALALVGTGRAGRPGGGRCERHNEMIRVTNDLIELERHSPGQERAHKCRDRVGYGQ
jgi:hypothetical protein